MIAVNSSLHVIYLYQHGEGKTFTIEAQSRTKLQHLWATTVEIVDVLEETKIKNIRGNPECFNNQEHSIVAYSAIEKVVADINGLNTLLVSTKNLDKL